MAEETTPKQYKQPSPKNEDFEKIQEWLYLCLSRWYWFALSLIVAFGLALLYLLVTTPSYTRKASILIKDEEKNRSLSSEFGQFTDIGFGVGKTNLYNEMITLASPSYMLDVVKDLHLDMNYMTDGRFHEITLYGKTQPVVVSLPDIDPEEYGAFTMYLKPNNVVELTDFFDVNHETPVNTLIKGELGKAIQTPIGKVLVTPTQNYVGKYDTPIRVKKNRLTDVANSYASRLVIELNQERASVIDISLTDHSAERAENILNKLFEVYNNKWVEDINKQAISTTSFIDEELRTIESQLGTVDADIAQQKSATLTPDLGVATQINLGRIENSTTQLLELDNQIYMAKMIKGQLSGNKMEVLPANTGISNQAVSAQIKDFNEKVIQRNSLIENSGINNPLIQDLDEQLSATRSSANTHLRSIWELCSEPCSEHFFLPFLQMRFP